MITAERQQIRNTVHYMSMNTLLGVRGSLHLMLRTEPFWRRPGIRRSISLIDSFCAEIQGNIR